MDLEEKDDIHANKYIKRTKISRHHIYGNKSHNSYSGARSRPTHENGVVENTRKINNDISNYHIIDYIPGRPHGRKTSAPGIISHDHKKHNKQIHPSITLGSEIGHCGTDIQSGEIPKGPNDIYQKIKLVHLPSIHKNMYLSTYKTVLNDQELLTQDEIYIVINLSTNEMARGLYKKIYNINFQDSRNISYNKFQNVANYVTDIINNIDNDKKFVICCDKGVNRSVSMVITYNITNKNRRLKTLDETIGYIIYKKNDADWPVLDNLKFHHYIQAIYQNNTSPTIIPDKTDCLQELL